MEPEKIEITHCEDNCPMWNNDRMYCQHPDMEFPENEWSIDGMPFKKCPLKNKPLLIEISEQ